MNTTNASTPIVTRPEDYAAAKEISIWIDDENLETRVPRIAHLIAQHRLPPSDELYRARTEIVELRRTLIERDAQIETLSETMAYHETNISGKNERIVELQARLERNSARFRWLEEKLGELPSDVSDAIFGSSDWTDIIEAIDEARR